MRQCKNYINCGFSGTEEDFPLIKDHGKMRRLNICINCKRQQGREYRKKNYNKYRESERASEKKKRDNPEWKNRTKLYNSIYSEKNRDRIKAYRDNWSTDCAVRYRKAKKTAMKRNIDFTLTIEEYANEINKSCYYCNYKLGSPVKFCTGLDRLDNSKPYEFDNVVSCCKTCNSIKGDFLSVEETKIAVQAILDYRFRKSSSAAARVS